MPKREKTEEEKKIWFQQIKDYHLRNPEQSKARIKKWSDNNKDKRATHAQVQKALRKGVLVRGNCEICGKEKTDAHHPDYSKPLEVQWLCRSHHRKEHHRIKPSTSSVASLTRGATDEETRKIRNKE